jgi:Ca-activated chloride channel family protein
VDFHFLRPAWLLAGLPVAVLLWRLAHTNPASGWRRLIEPHLLSALTVRTGESSSWLRPGVVLGLFWGLAVLALAGPAWERQPGLFAEEEAAIAIVLHLGPSMDAEDVQPTRLERATHKIQDLLALRGGAPTALVVYAGSAHPVLPFTTDQALIVQMAAELATDIMPKEGDAVGEAIALARDMLAKRDGSGHILLITDSITPDAIEGLAASDLRAEILAVAAPPDAPLPSSGPPAPSLDRETFSRAARALGGGYVEVSADSSDVERLARRLEQREQVGSSSEDERWRDAGYALVFPVAALWALGFRRGFTIRWGEGG